MTLNKDNYEIMLEYNFYTLLVNFIQLCNLHLVSL